jgi:hypothetical protein
MYSHAYDQTDESVGNAASVSANASKTKVNPLRVILSSTHDEGSAPSVTLMLSF